MEKARNTVARRILNAAKRYEDLDFTDDFMFCKILQNNPQICKELTELILGKKIGGIVQIDRQESIEITADGKGVRFDIYMEDDEQTTYDIEMQKGLFKAIPKRARYYQGMIDLNHLERGAKYEDLKPCYIIFICMENPFPELGLHKYTFRNVCDEKPDFTLDDGAVKVILSAEGTADDVSEEMKGFLAFLTTRQSSTELTCRLKEEVEKARRHEKWRMEYMTLQERDERMREEGREEGRIEVLVSMTCKKLAKGKTPQEISEDLEEDVSVIRRICDVAAGFSPEYPVDDVLAALEEDRDKANR